MANTKYTKLLPAWVRKTDKKQDSDHLESSNTNKKDQRADSSPDKHLQAITPTTDTSRAMNIDLPGPRSGYNMTFDDRRRWGNPLESRIVASSFDTPDNTPLLSHESSGSDPPTRDVTYGNEQLPDQDPRQALLLSQPAPPFRVIIVGGGPTGLVLAHALHQACIKYTLLEQAHHIAVTDTPDPIQPHENGTSFLLWPDSARILDQLGLLPQVQQISCPVRTRTTRSSPGKNNDDVFARAEHDNGRPCVLISRAALLRLLWEALPGCAARVRMAKEVVSVETHDTGVRVVCKDGSIHEGSVVVGCDGVHSVVRRTLCELRDGGKKKSTQRSFRLFGLGGSGSIERTDRTMEARYYGLIGSGPLLDGLEPGVCYESRSDSLGATFQVFTSEDKVHFLVYVPLHRPVIRQIQYPLESANYLAWAVGKHPITEKIEFRDLWLSRRCGKMLDFLEGIADKWYQERIVLAGSAAHSTTPVLGLGVNASLQGVAELANGLRRLLPFRHHRHEPRFLPPRHDSADTVDLKRVFRAYQAAREDHARTTALISSFYARAIAHQGTLSKVCNWAAPGVAGDIKLLDKQVAWAVRQGITLNFVREEHFSEGRLRWVNPWRRVADVPIGQRTERSVWIYPGIPFSIRGR